MSNNLKNSGWGNNTLDFRNKSIAYAKTAQQSASTSNILSNNALKLTKVYDFKFIKFLLFIIYYVKFCFGLFRGRGSFMQ